MSTSHSNEVKHWHAVYVKMHHERKVRDRLNSMGIENYLPIIKEVRQWSDRRKEIETMLIPMIVFVRVSSSQRNQLLNIPAVYRYLVLRGEKTPAIIPDHEMDSFRFMIDYSETPVNMQERLLKPGEFVRVIKGPLKGLQGDLITVGDKSRIAVRIAQLGYASVELNASFVEKIE